MPTPSGHTTAIRASRVIGTRVKNTAGEVIGEVEDVILDKMSNQIMFAVVGFGGFLGMGEKYHAVPWSVLDYVPEEAAYVVPFSRQQLETAPHDTIGELTKGDGHPAREAAFRHYGVTRDWK
jgi:sporulation protein YlmC with PRC-barrel domain